MYVRAAVGVVQKEVGRAMVLINVGQGSVVLVVVELGGRGCWPTSMAMHGPLMQGFVSWERRACNAASLPDLIFG